MKQRSNPLDWIEVENAMLEVDQFPDGSFSFSVDFGNFKPYDIYVTLKSTLPEALVALHQVVDAIRRYDEDLDIFLYIQTMPDQRADKVERNGQCVAASVSAKLIALTDPTDITIYDPHSQVCVNTLQQVLGDHRVIITSPLDCFLDTLYEADGEYAYQIDAVVAVDKGAEERAADVAGYFGAEVIYADKKRVNGKIVGHEITGATAMINPDDNIWIVDDLCDGGATFISIAKLLRETYQFNELNLYVTHGLFSRGKEELSKHYNHILSHFDYSSEPR